MCVCLVYMAWLHNQQQHFTDVTNGDGKSTPVPNCPLKPVEGRPKFYILGGLIRPCAEGTKFSLFQCTCIHDYE